MCMEKQLRENIFEQKSVLSANTHIFVMALGALALFSH